MRPLISVIVPIYNVEKYIDKCLSSIRDQTLQELEILCIDDCSPDNSYKIVEKHAREDSRIRLIRHKVNKGLGGARNTGILAASADYIAAIDSDDTIKADMMERLWSALDNEKHDMVCCGYERLSESGKVLFSQSFDAKIINIDSNTEIFSVVNISYVNKLWRKNIFFDHDIFFPEHMYYEDLAIVPLLVAKCHSISIIEDCLYEYWERGDSIMATYSSRHVLDFFRVFELHLDFLKDNNSLIEKHSDFVKQVDTHMIYNAKQVVKSSMLEAETRHYLYLFLMMKISFLDNHLLLATKTRQDLLVLLKTAHSSKELDKTAG
ncbi:glycosyltransferase [Candidatus Gracilibacteria bacterium]|nr:glycosyltransferase [Candidatus Gracilibacteria bacterium]